MAANPNMSTGDARMIANTAQWEKERKGEPMMPAVSEDSRKLNEIRNAFKKMPNLFSFDDAGKFIAEVERILK
jgi:hypothetical protein